MLAPTSSVPSRRRRGCSLRVLGECSKNVAADFLHGTKGAVDSQLQLIVEQHQLNSKRTSLGRWFRPPVRLPEPRSDFFGDLRG